MLIENVSEGSSVFESWCYRGADQNVWVTEPQSLFVVTSHACSIWSFLFQCPLLSWVYSVSAGIISSALSSPNGNVKKTKTCCISCQPSLSSINDELVFSWTLVCWNFMKYKIIWLQLPVYFKKMHLLTRSTWCLSFLHTIIRFVHI